MRHDARGDGRGTDTPALASEPSCGYLWKTLFLPDGTQLRMTVSHHTYHARVVGDHIMYEGRSVTPRGLTLAIAGEGRNAWRDLWIRFPGAAHWKGANRCRIEAQNVEHPIQLSPAESMRLAAAALTEALAAALALSKQGIPAHGGQQDRRVERHRRESDFLGDACAFD
ncbi:MAG: hypothetical protein V4723_05215 [Pseudomonadota bacterium]